MNDEYATKDDVEKQGKKTRICMAISTEIVLVFVSGLSLFLFGSTGNAEFYALAWLGIVTSLFLLWNAHANARRGYSHITWQVTLGRFEKFHIDKTVEDYNDE